MCGIVGMAGPGVLRDDHNLFQQLMQVSTIRGQDGTGIIQAEFKGEDKKSSWMVEKQPMEVNAFFNWINTKEGNPLVLNSLFDNVYIGHVRDATKGTYAKENCHPFHSKSIIGVHNGTLEDSAYQDNTKSDSLLLYQDIAKNGAKKVLEELYPSSAYALNWIDTATEKVYFARNTKRPLHVCKNKKRGVIYWASEAGMLEWMLDRHGIDYTAILYFAENQIYSLNPREIEPDALTIPFSIEKFTPCDWENLPEGKFFRRARAKHYQQLWGYAGIDYDSYDDEWSEPTSYPNTGSNTTSTSTNSNTNKVITLSRPLTPLGEIQKKDGKIPHEECFGCKKELSLVDQYFAEKVPIDGRTLYECQPCVNLEISLKAEKVAL